MWEDQPQYEPAYYLEKQKQQPIAGDHLIISGAYYSVLPDHDTLYYLYNSIRLFYQNGGGDAYIVAVGGYGDPSGNAKKDPAVPSININVKLKELTNGLALLKSEEEPTIYIYPEATLLPVPENGALMQSMLMQAKEMQTTICIFDVIGGKSPNPLHQRY